MIFVTVGSSLPFDRLIRTVDEVAGEGALEGRIFGQIADGRYEPKHFPSERYVDRARYAGLVEAADVIISHAGIGTISMALQMGKPVAVMPRLKSLGELVDDHQRATAAKFKQMGHVMSFADAAELRSLAPTLKGFVPVPRRPNADGIAREIGSFLAGLYDTGSHRQRR